MMRKEFKIGIFAVVVIVASFFVLNYLRGQDIFNREVEYVTTCSNLEGLVATAPIYIKGYKAGKVTEVTYMPSKAQFTVLCSVSRDFRVPVDSRMVIYSVDIMGGKGIRIDLGTSEEVAADGDTLVSCHEAGLMDAVSAKLVPMLDKIGQTIDSLGVTVSGINSILSDSNVTYISGTLRHVESLMGNLNDISSDIEGKSSEITSLIDNLKQFSDGLESLMENVDSTVAGVSAAVASVNAADLTGTVNSLKTLVDNINDPDGSVGKLFVDDSIYNSVDSLLSNLDRFVDKIQENPKKYMKFSIF